MSGPVEFYFDFSSPYGYIAAQKIDQIAEENGRSCVWKPFLVGVAMKQTGMTPLIGQPMRGEYSLNDLNRLGRFMNVPFQMPERFPFLSVAAGRAFYWINDRDSDQARLLAKSLLHASFGEGGDISTPEAVADIAAALFVDRDELLAAMKDPAVKEKLKVETDQAIAKGVFGSPYFIVDGEGFWGSDRMWMVKKWLQQDGW